MRFKEIMLGLAALALTVTPALSADMTLRFGHVGKPGSLFDLSAEEFARRANEKLGDKAEVRSSARRSSATTRSFCRS